MMNVDILNQINDKWLNNEQILENMKLLWFTILPTIATLYGWIKPTLKKFSLNKNSRARKGILLGKVGDESLRNFLKRYGVLVCDMVMIIINVLIIFGIMNLFALFDGIRKSNISVKVCAVILILMVTVIIIIAALIGKKRYSQLYRKIKPMMCAVCGGMLAIILATFFEQNPIVCKAILAIVSITFISSIVITLYQCGVYKVYKYPVIIICRTIRIIMLVGYSLYTFIKLQFCGDNIIIITWMVLCCIEYFWIGKKDDTRFVNVVLHTKCGEKITREKIIQYEGNKIGYKLLDGREEIVDDDAIEMITYQIEHLPYKSYKAKYTVECKLRNGNILKYQDYSLINDSWVHFSTYEEGVRNVSIMKIKDTEEIMEEKICS